jgi:isoleucyl-tRNA synthetase
MISIRTMAPFTPFLTELMYQNLKKIRTLERREESIHYLMIPKYNEKLVFKDIEEKILNMQKIVEIGNI